MTGQKKAHILYSLFSSEAKSSVDELLTAREVSLLSESAESEKILPVEITRTLKEADLRLKEKTSVKFFLPAFLYLFSNALLIILSFAGNNHLTAATAFVYIFAGFLTECLYRDKRKGAGKNW